MNRVAKTPTENSQSFWDEGPVARFQATTTAAKFGGNLGRRYPKNMNLKFCKQTLPTSLANI